MIRSRFRVFQYPDDNRVDPPDLPQGAVAANRIASVDIYRALVMLTMIFVNSLVQLNDAPNWLLHTAADVDGMGFSDLVLPAFLVIIGLAIPPALDNRLNKEQKAWHVSLHVLTRALSLIVMGWYFINFSHLSADIMLITKHQWQLGMFLAFFLIWNDYSKPRSFMPILLKCVGWAILIFLAIIFRTDQGGWMRPYWWDILGILGFAYLLGAMVYLVIDNRPLLLTFVAIVLLGLNCIEVLWFNKSIFVVSASNHFMVVAGIAAASALSLIRGGSVRFGAFMVLSGALLLILFGFATRPIWEISKIRATPSWAAICTAISLITYLAVRYVADIRGHTRWMKPLMPAGSATLTCYILSFAILSIAGYFGIYWPEIFKTGWLGLMACLGYALLVVLVAKGLGLVSVRLRI